MRRELLLRAMKYCSIFLVYCIPMILAFHRQCISVTHRHRGIYHARILFSVYRDSFKNGNDCWSLAMSTDNIERKTLALGSHMAEMEVKKSRFLGYAKHVETWDEAQQYIQEVKSEHPKGRHWCYGFRCGVNPVQERCSDDGEPTGTAGLPILGAIKGEELSDTVCVVVRYFGGIKLGAGGLIRAYGASARQVLREAPIDVLIPKSSFRVVVQSSDVGALYDGVGKVGGQTSGEEYGTDGSLTATVTCNLEFTDQLREGLRDATRGNAQFPDDDDSN